MFFRWVEELVGRLVSFLGCFAFYSLDWRFEGFFVYLFLGALIAFTRWGKRLFDVCFVLVLVFVKKVEITERLFVFFGFFFFGNLF